MSESKFFYRALPKTIKRPSFDQLISKEEFDGIEKKIIQKAPPTFAGHAGTTVWHGNNYFIIQISFKNQPDVYAKTICTFEPQFGMDRMDGFYAQDIEELILKEKLGFETKRLNVFGDLEEIDVFTYMISRGLKISKTDNPDKYQITI